MRRRKKIRIVLLLIGLCLLVFSIGFIYDKKTLAVNENVAKAENKILREEQYNKTINDRRIRETLPIVECWGDSLTAGTGGEGVTYPNVLSKLIKLKTVNYGVGGETSELIAIRQGSVPIYVNELNFPKGQESVEISLYDDNGQKVILGRQGDAGLNPCYLGEVKGSIIYDEEQEKMFFNRVSSVNEVKIEKGTQLITSVMKEKNDNSILVIFSGSNNLPNSSTIYDVINIQRKMIEYSGTNNYIVIGLTSKDYMPDIEEVNEILKSEYGDKFLDIRTYILETGLKDAEVEGTEQDNIDIQNGEIPSSLRVDTIHGNAKFYELVGNQVYNKIIQLGYINDEQKQYLGIN